jgi:hypothetical protein
MLLPEDRPEPKGRPALGSEDVRQVEIRERPNEDLARQIESLSRADSTRLAAEALVNDDGTPRRPLVPVSHKGTEEGDSNWQTLAYIAIAALTLGAGAWLVRSVLRRRGSDI